MSASIAHAVFSAALIPVLVFLYWSLSAQIIILCNGNCLRTSFATFNKLPLSNAIYTHSWVAS